MYPVDIRTDDRLQSKWDKTLFFGVFVVGTALILLEKASSIPAVVAPVTGIGAIVLYCAVAWKSPRFRIREDRIGDSAYYLGFLFTLVSLSWALYQFTEQGGTERVISGFGIALATTIFGLAARVFFQQMREDPVEIEQAVRHSLNDQVLHLQRELRLIIESLSLIRNRIQEEVGQAVGSGLREILSDSREAVKAETELFHAAIGAPLEAVKQAVLASTTHAAETRKSTGRLLKAIDGLAERIEQTKAPTDGFKEKVDEYAATLARMLTREKERTEKNRESADSILSVYKEMEARALDSAVVMEECKKAVEAMHAVMNESTVAAEKMVATGTKVTDEMLRRSQDHLDLLGRLSEMSSKSEADLRKLTNSLESQVQMSAGALAALERNVVQASELIVRELNAQ
jgi:hypothetical protein